MSAQHTLGPWRANRLATFAEPGWVILWPDTSKPGVHHRRLDYQGNFTEADARLIATAPELLAALQDLQELAVLLASNCADRVDVLHDPRIGAARAAIAKAEAIDEYKGVRCICVQTGCRAAPGCPHYGAHCKSHVAAIAKATGSAP